MRLWSIHPKYLDAKGLVALWREGLLAQHVLLGKTRGYKHHPQLLRFKNSTNPAGSIASYLRVVVTEADARGYRFDRSKINPGRVQQKLPVTAGQCKYEFAHLLKKLKTRDPERYKKFLNTSRIDTHALFERVRGGVESWEITD